MPPRKPLDPRASTRSGYSIPHEGPQDDDEPTIAMPKAPPSAPAAISVPTPAYGLSGEDIGVRKSIPIGTIEIEYIQETNLANIRSSTATMLEIWTRNRIYHVDAEMRCVAVLSRANMQPEAAHSLIGARLTGGERRSKSSAAIEIYYPLPMPGTEAVFRSEQKRHGQYGHTSTIERVVMRVRKVRVGSMDTSTSWDEITGRFVPR
jgi:hypothetical protein